MKVRELIKELMDYNMDATVTTKHTETVEVGFISGCLEDDKTFSKADTPLVFIDGCDYEDG